MLAADGVPGRVLQALVDVFQLGMSEMLIGWTRLPAIEAQARRRPRR